MRREPERPTVAATMSASSSSSLSITSSGAGPRAGSRAAAGALDREHLLDRLDRLRAILPAFAEELASSRRQAAALRVENRGLLAEVRRLQRQSVMGGPSYAPVNMGSRSIQGGRS
jgi:hypothetical protein